MSAAERKLRGLKNRKRSIVASFSGINTFVSGYQPERDKREVPVRLENLIALWEEFNNVQIELETLEEDNDVLDAYLKERMELERVYYHVKGTLLLWNQSEAQQVTPQSTANVNQAHVKLPDIKLPIFSGKFEEWLNFHDLFISLVHSSPNLSTIQKFYYLRSSLVGEALQLIQTIPISNEQYSIAWNLLVSRYQNTRRLKRAYVHSLFEFPIMKRETVNELHLLIDKFQSNVKILQQLGEQTNHWDVLLIHLLSTRLDPLTRRGWEKYSEINDATKYQQLIEFLQHRVNVLETVSGSSTTQPNFQKTNALRVGSYGTAQQNLRSCPACSGDHLLYQCETFFEMSIDEREGLVQRYRLCRNCLRRGHDTRECISENCCRKCNGRHHTKLCSTSVGGRIVNSATATRHDRLIEPNQFNDDEREISPTPAAYTGVASYPSQRGVRSKVLLGTAMIVMIDDFGTEHIVKALLDSGSECSFATEELANRMKVRRSNAIIPIAGIGQSITQTRYKFQTTVKSRITSYSTTIEAFILPRVTVNLPTLPVDASSWPIPTGIHLADPSFYQSSPIDVVLGADVFFDLFNTDGRISLGESLPNLINSALGWIVSGRIVQERVATPAVCSLAAILHTIDKPIPTVTQCVRGQCDVHRYMRAVRQRHRYRSLTFIHRTEQTNTRLRQLDVQK